MPNENPFNSGRGCESAANEVSFITNTESERIEDLSCQLNFCKIIFWVTRLKGYGLRNENFVQPPRLQAIS